MFLKNVKRQLLKCSIYFSNFKIHSQYICYDFFGRKEDSIADRHYRSIFLLSPI